MSVRPSAPALSGAALELVAPVFAAPACGALTSQHAELANMRDLPEQRKPGSSNLPVVVPRRFAGLRAAKQSPGFEDANRARGDGLQRVAVALARGFLRGPSATG